MAIEIGHSPTTAMPGSGLEAHPFRLQDQITAPSGTEYYVMHARRTGAIFAVPELEGATLLAIPAGGEVTAGYAALETQVQSKMPRGERARRDLLALLDRVSPLAESLGTPIRSRQGNPKQRTVFGFYYDPVDEAALRDEAPPPPVEQPAPVVATEITTRRTRTRRRIVDDPTPPPAVTEPPATELQPATPLRPSPTAMPRRAPRPVPAPPPQRPSQPGDVRTPLPRSTERSRDNRVPFFFPGETEPTLVERRHAAILTALSPFTSSDEAPRLVHMADIPQGKFRGVMHDLRKNIITPHGYRLTIVEAEGKDDGHYFVEKSQTQAKVTLLGEHLVTDNGRFVLTEEEYLEVRKSSKAFSVGGAHVDAIPHVNTILGLTTGVEDAIELRTAAGGQQFYDMPRVSVRRWPQYDPLLPRELLGVDAFLEAQASGTPSDHIIATMPSPGDPPDRESIADTIHWGIARLHSRDALGIATERTEGTIPSEAALVQKLAAYRKEHGVSERDLVDIVTFQLTGAHITAGKMLEILARWNPGALAARKRQFNVPLIPRPESTTVLAAVEPELPPSESYTPVQVTTMIAGVCDELLGWEGIDLTTDRTTGYIANKFGSPDVTRERLDELIAAGIVAPAERDDEREKQQSVHWLKPAGVVAAITRIRYPELQQDIDSAVQAELGRRQANDSATYRERGRRRFR